MNNLIDRLRAATSSEQVKGIVEQAKNSALGEKDRTKFERAAEIKLDLLEGKNTAVFWRYSGVHATGAIENALHKPDYAASLARARLGPKVQQNHAAVKLSFDKAICGLEKWSPWGPGLPSFLREMELPGNISKASKDFVQALADHIENDTQTPRPPETAESWFAKDCLDCSKNGDYRGVDFHAIAKAVGGENFGEQVSAELFQQAFREGQLPNYLREMELPGNISKASKDFVQALADHIENDTQTPRPPETAESWFAKDCLDCFKNGDYRGVDFHAIAKSVFGYRLTANIVHDRVSNELFREAYNRRSGELS